MKATRLTAVERKVLYGLCQYPELSDTELAAKLDVKRSSLTAARNRLIRRGFLKYFYLPDFNLLGLTIMGSCFGSFTPGVTFSKRRKTSAFAVVSKNPHLVFGWTTDTDYMGFFLAKDFAEIKQLLQNVWFDKYGGHGFLADLDTVVTPLKLSETECFFDFVEKLRELFSLQNGGRP